MTLFCLPFPAGSSANPELVSWRVIREEQRASTSFQRKQARQPCKRRPNIVKNVTHKSIAAWKSCVTCGARHETDIYCAIKTDGPRMGMGLLRGI